MKTIIVEDEEIAVKALRQLLAKHADLFEVTAVACNGQEAADLIEEHKPALVFLDIEMPVFNGFEVLKRISYNPLVIFTTAYDAYAVKAFEENSVDYLLKPIEEHRFDKAVEKLRERSGQENIDVKKLTEMIRKLQTKKEIHSLTVKSGEKLIFIQVNEITHFFAEDRYVFLNTLESKQHLTGYTIQNLEEILPATFVRISRSVIINARQIFEAQRFFTGNYMVYLKDIKRSKVETGRRYVENFTRLLNT